MTKVELQELFIDLIYESDDTRTCDGNCETEGNTEIKCRICAKKILDEYEEAIRKEVLEKLEGDKRDGH